MSTKPVEDPAGLIHVWNEAITSFRDVAGTVAEGDWTTPTELPGWSVADVVAHVVGIERSIAGDGLPEHTPDWEKLPHVRGDFGRLTEIDVDSRRGTVRDCVLAELDEVIARRHHQLLTQLEQSDALGTVTGPFGWELPFPRLMQVRIFDIWTHEQDIRRAVAQPGGFDSDAATVAFARILSGWLVAWSKVAPNASVLEVHSPPLTVAIQRDETGRSRVSDMGVVPAAVVLDLDPTELLRLATGRTSEAERHDLEARFVARGSDPELAATFVGSAAITP